MFLRMLLTVHSYPQRSHVMTGIIQGYSKMCSNEKDPAEAGPSWCCDYRHLSISLLTAQMRRDSRESPTVQVSLGYWRR